MVSLSLFFVMVVMLATTNNVQSATVTMRGTPESEGLVLVSNSTTEVTFSVISSSGDPFTLATFPTADMITVTAELVDDYGNALDIDNDGIADIWNCIEDPDVPGLWKANITIGVDSEPGIYLLKIKALAKNSTTDEIIDQGNLTVETLILGGQYAIQFFNVKEDDRFELGSLDIRIGALSDLGSIVSIGDITDTLTLRDNNADGVWGQRIDVNNDGSIDGWLTFIQNGDNYDMILFTNNQSLIDSLMPEESFKIRGDEITFRNRLLRETRDYRHFNYYTQILWDNSFWANAGLKATDYYIVPYKGRENWKITQFSNGRILSAVMRVKIVKRTTILGLFTREEVPLDGNIWTTNTKRVDELSLQPRAILWSWYPSAGYGVIWKAAVDITATKGYSIKQKQDYNVEFRGDNPLDGLNWLSRQLSKDHVDWWKLLGGDEE